MKYSNEQIDEMILKALDEEDKKYFEGLEEPNLIELYLDTYRGKSKWITILLTITTFVLIVFTFYIGYQFYYATEIREMLVLGMIFLTGLITITALKIWFWMQMNNNAILREIKRLELQIAMKKDN